MHSYHKVLYLTITTFFLYACGGNSSESTNGNSSSPRLSSDSNNSTTSTDDPSNINQNNEDYFYFSYDDSASTAAKDLSLFSIENAKLPDMNWGRAYEFLNAETFPHFSEEEAGPFNVSMGIYKTNKTGLPLNEKTQSVIAESEHDSIYALGINLSGPTMSIEERPNVVLTFIVDVSSSMLSDYAFETRSDITSLIDVTQHGLISAYNSFKEGDVINIASFNQNAKIVVNDLVIQENENAVRSAYVDAVKRLKANGSTNLNAGIELAYDYAIRSYDPTKANRVVIITDAFANTGEVNAQVIARNTTINAQEGIHFAGIGVGSSFNDEFLNELTDIGKGVYSAMVTPEDAEKIFQQGFMRFIDNAVDDVRFKLIKPSTATHLQSAAEEISSNEDDVQTINFSYNDSQFFFELFSSVDELSDNDVFTLEITYSDKDGKRQTITLDKTIDELSGLGKGQIFSAAAITSLAHLISTDMECGPLKQSSFYTATINEEDRGDESNALYLKYKSLIDSYCDISQAP